MIQIVPYSSTWPEEFAQIGRKIREAVGAHALAIHHIGSTSVPSLAAKDTIDIQITVKDLELPIRPLLEGIGFQMLPHITKDHCPPGMKVSDADLEKRFFKRIDRAMNLHIRKEGAFNQKYPVLFRDYLRSNAMARNAYAEIKKQLAVRFSEDQDAYYDVKDPVCDIIIAAALEWSQNLGWKISPSDA